jgi:hypothetical protein
MNYEDGRIGDRVEICGHYGTIIAIDPNDCCLPYTIDWDELPSPMRVLPATIRKVGNGEKETESNRIQMSIL